ncbi:MULTISPECIES: SWIM zinc finger family protein [unclassified Undibacterium]|uniref:SWIM zinc finger family protein n=1 Tax=unclassified Undibacterium TaxID=2630295 RepID=UPI002AC9512C|nr:MULTISPECIES: SWIM zinc finger family protein [unclassified Undibacterium]MEB0139420.1 SWIM zinc finger family protein [Undibacterium sp. CCC2.1]MEB0174059.1 SWIM zinc finger family protein [Undibacterium sp. CCC1.1]MEB0177450.1 SWIM zinc finger family protein [Undibacterium sp. CCC3.4]MEB0216621.1 SWIM zinc finger family protein [Undibacterium sp. 5I2]WPX44009.1 SWIM zinc finger family protein [Undibacterium sp. CCC3.4]
MGQRYGAWGPYISVAERRRQAERVLASLRKKGRNCQPVVVEGRAIARSFWGKKWCENLEAYSDYANRLPRGRSYVRNGSVLDLQIVEGKISALVSGAHVYEVSISVQPLEKTRWKAVLEQCAGKLASLLELLQGRISEEVMELVSRPQSGLFPAPKQISLRCSCPDSASMCKHIAAVLYGVGTRFDSQPELLFRLRHVDPSELIQQAGSLSALSTSMPGGKQSLDSADLSALFGIDLEPSPLTTAAAPTPSQAASGSSQKPPAKKTGAAGAVRAKTITAKQLEARGIAPHIRYRWLESGVLLRTEQRGVYGVTKKTEPYIEQYRRATGLTRVLS